jgi:lysophospholipase L1-like esterase
VLRIFPWATAGTITAVVTVPLVQAAVVWRTRRPAVAGPHHQDGLISGLSDASGPTRFVWLGDSLACGVGAGTPDAAFARRAVALWSASEGRAVELTCLARSGSQAADVLREQGPAAVDLLGPGTVAVITVGANDVAGLTRPRSFRRDYRAILDSLSATGASVVAVGLPDLGSAAIIPHPLRAVARRAGRRADRHVQRMATAYDAHFVSIDTRAPWRTKPATYLAADRWHPNDDTYNLWAGRVAALLTPLLAFNAASVPLASDHA